jgi:hypothetical protein
MKAVRPSDLNSNQLRDFAGSADHASTTASSLVLALEEFIKEAAARPTGKDKSKAEGKGKVPVEPVVTKGLKLPILP